MDDTSFTLDDLNNLNRLPSHNFDSTCKICNIKTSHIIFHLKMNHGKRQDDSDSIANYYENGCKCHLCGLAFGFKRQLLDHMINHIPAVYCACGRVLSVVKYEKEYGYPDHCWSCAVYHT